MIIRRLPCPTMDGPRPPPPAAATAKRMQLIPRVIRQRWPSRPARRPPMSGPSDRQGQPCTPRGAQTSVVRCLRGSAADNQRQRYIHFSGLQRPRPHKFDRKRRAPRSRFFFIRQGSHCQAWRAYKSNFMEINKTHCEMHTQQSCILVRNSRSKHFFARQDVNGSSLIRLLPVMIPAGAGRVGHGRARSRRFRSHRTTPPPPSHETLVQLSTTHTTAHCTYMAREHRVCLRDRCSACRTGAGCYAITITSGHGAGCRPMDCAASVRSYECITEAI